jgi:hypothetical protein
MAAAIDYMNPDLPHGLDIVTMPVVIATEDTLRGYGCLVDDPNGFHLEIVKWPAAGWRPIDDGTGDEAGTKVGIFESEWKGDFLFGRNAAVGGNYILAYNTLPELATLEHSDPPSQMMLWHANYHPDGGQLFFPLQNAPFYVPLALPTDDITPQQFVCFAFDGSKGLYIHPNIWHEGVFAKFGCMRFHDEQGAVHARVSVNFAKEFGCLLRAPLD